MMQIDYSLSRVDPEGIIWEATYKDGLNIDETLNFYHYKVYTGIYKRFPKDWPNYAQAGVKIWYSLESLNH